MDSEGRYEVLKVNDDGTTLVKDKVTNKVGILGTDNGFLISCKYDYIGDFNDGLVPVKKDGETYYIDTSGNRMDNIDSDKSNEQSSGKTL